MSLIILGTQVYFFFLFFILMKLQTICNYHHLHIYHKYLWKRIKISFQCVLICYYFFFAEIVKLFFFRLTKLIQVEDTSTHMNMFLKCFLSNACIFDHTCQIFHLWLVRSLY